MIIQIKQQSTASRPNLAAQAKALFGPDASEFFNIIKVINATVGVAKIDLDTVTVIQPSKPKKVGFEYDPQIVRNILRAFDSLTHKKFQVHDMPVGGEAFKTEYTNVIGNFRFTIKVSHNVSGSYVSEIEIKHSKPNPDSIDWLNN